MKFTAATAGLAGSKGGNAVVNKYGKEHMSRIGKKGFAATCAKYWHGDKEAFQTYLRRKSMWVNDPCPWNGAYKQHKLEWGKV